MRRSITRRGSSFVPAVKDEYEDRIFRSSVFRIVDGKIHARGIDQIVIQRMATALGITVDDLEARLLRQDEAASEKESADVRHHP